MSRALLIPVGDAELGREARVNVFVHGYRSMVSPVDVETAQQRVERTHVAGDSYLVRWMAGRWSESAVFAGLRAAYKARRLGYAFTPWALALDAGVIGLHEAAQFKRMERRAEAVGRLLPSLLAGIAGGRPINLIGHSLGARAVHAALRHAPGADLSLDDVVLLGGAADLDASDWPACVRLLHVGVACPQAPTPHSSPASRHFKQ